MFPVFLSSLIAYSVAPAFSNLSSIIFFDFSKFFSVNTDFSFSLIALVSFEKPVSSTVVVSASSKSVVTSIESVVELVSCPSETLPLTFPLEST